MFQYSGGSNLLAISFYKNFVIRNESQTGIDFEEVIISQQQKDVLFQSFINFHYEKYAFTHTLTYSYLPYKKKC